MTGDDAAAVRIDVEPGKVREFACAVHADLDDLATDDGGLRIPPTFLTTMLFHEDPAETLAAMEMDPSRVLHAEQEFEFHGPVPLAGSTLRAESHVSDRYEKRGARGGLLRFAVRVTEFRDPDGRLVASARMTSVEPGSPARATAGAGA